MEQIEPPLNCKEYGHGFGKLETCGECAYADFCKDSVEVDKQHVEYTTKDKHGNIERIADQEKASNVSGLLIAELLKLSGFNPIRFYVVICRLGNLTYKEISNLIGVSDVLVFKYCETLPPQIKNYLKNKSLTMLEIEEAFQTFDRTEYFQRLTKRQVAAEMEGVLQAE